MTLDRRIQLRRHGVTQSFAKRRGFTLELAQSVERDLYLGTVGTGLKFLRIVREVVQITLTRAVRKLDTFRAESALFTWLCAICRNEVSDWLRRQGRYRDHIVLVEDFPEVQAAVDSFHAPLEDSPERHYERVEAMRLIQVALDRLPAKYGDVLEWKYVEGHSVKEISAKLDIGAEATQSLLARAKRAFADVYSSMNKAIDNESNGLVQS